MDGVQGVGGGGERGRRCGQQPMDSLSWPSQNTPSVSASERSPPRCSPSHHSPLHRCDIVPSQPLPPSTPPLHPSPHCCVATLTDDVAELPQLSLPVSLEDGGVRGGSAPSVSSIVRGPRQPSSVMDQDTSSRIDTPP